MSKLHADPKLYCLKKQGKYIFQPFGSQWWIKKILSNGHKLQRQHSYGKEWGSEGGKARFYFKLTFIKHSKDAEGKLRMTDSEPGAALQSKGLRRKTSANCEGRRKWKGITWRTGGESPVHGAMRTTPRSLTAFLTKDVDKLETRPRWTEASDGWEIRKAYSGTWKRSYESSHGSRASLWTKPWSSTS